MLDPASWLHLAKETNLGGRRRVDHDCGSGRTMIVAHTERGYNAYCWRCSDDGFQAHPQPSMAERLVRLKAVQTAEAAVEADVRPPMPANFDPSTWPLEARVWLYKAGFTNDTIRANGFYYCERINRVVLPVVAGNRVVYWQARGFDKCLPKYLNPPVDRTKLAPLFGGPRSTSQRLLVLTEDILSAVRVGEAAQSRSLLGTALSDRVLIMVREHDCPVVVWLDPDGPGRRASAKIVRKLLNYGIQARAIHTPLDPKCYSNEEIAKFLLN